MRRFFSVKPFPTRSVLRDTSMVTTSTENNGADAGYASARSLLKNSRWIIATIQA
jgi:hypothetical protein